VSAGRRNGRPRTFEATWILVVRAAIHVISVHVSNEGFAPWGWSQIETRSNPSSSARRACTTGSERPVADGMIETPKLGVGTSSSSVAGLRI
jgi:hypothetical protein